VGNVSLNLKEMMSFKESAVSKLTKGIEGLFKKNKVDYIKGHGRFTSPHDITVDLLAGGQQTVRAKNVLIATGSEPTPFAGIPIDEKQIVTSTGALSLDRVPEKMIVIGGGIIGLELGSVWNRLGAEVTVVEYMDAIGAGMDKDMAKMFHKILAKQGIKFKLSTKVLGADKVDGKVNINVESAKGGAQESVRMHLYRDVAS
jgi:dihydrolipoamide dehydrogenase